MPQTNNGKIDRRSLPEPVVNVPVAAGEVVAPSNDIQRKISEIWIDVLNIPSVGVQQNFFDIGGHSLLTIEVLNKLKYRSIFSVPLIQSIAWAKNQYLTVF